MALRTREDTHTKHNANLSWILLLLVLGVLALSILAFNSPVSEGGQETAPTEMSETDPGADAPEMTQTAEAETLPPTPEEIGYTDGIIFMSTLLILILLVGTLRETLRRKRR
jgi:flagellar basal body-associated protein FliL